MWGRTMGLPWSLTRPTSSQGHSLPSPREAEPTHPCPLGSLEQRLEGPSQSRALGAFRLPQASQAGPSRPEGAPDQQGGLHGHNLCLPGKAESKQRLHSLGSGRCLGFPGEQPHEALAASSFISLNLNPLLFFPKFLSSKDPAYRGGETR